MCCRSSSIDIAWKQGWLEGNAGQAIGLSKQSVAAAQASRHCVTVEACCPEPASIVGNNLVAVISSITQCAHSTHQQSAIAAVDFSAT
jgi:hypothetical protein